MCFANNWVGWQIVGWLREREEDIAAVVIHPPERQRHVREILKAAGVPREAVFEGSRLAQPEVRDAVLALKPDLGVSLMFGYVLSRELLRGFPAGVINVHPSLLPHNRGAYPNVWSIIEGTPAGVSLHYVDDRLDAGDLIAQRVVAVEPVDTGETLYRRLERASVELFQELWPAIRDGRAPRTPQPAGIGATHRIRDVDAMDRIDVTRQYAAGELLNILRARTFPPFRGAFIEVGGRRVYLSLGLEYGDEEQGRS
ncbi:MAG TPA: formyltransferase family protein [bacterium]